MVILDLEDWNFQTRRSNHLKFFSEGNNKLNSSRSNGAKRCLYINTLIQKYDWLKGIMDN